MASEGILISMVKLKGIDRQVCHRWMQEHAWAAAEAVKSGQTAENDFLLRLRNDQRFAGIHESLDEIVDPERFIGCCVPQVDRFLAEKVVPALAPYDDKHQSSVELHV